MKLPSNVSKILYNKYFLYFIYFLTGSTILGYMVKGKINAIIFFALVAFLTSNFSKNISVILGVAIVLTNLLMAGNSIKEGLENNASTTTAAPKPAAPKPAAPKPDDKKKDTPIIEDSGTDAEATPPEHDAAAVTNLNSATPPSAESMNVMSRKRNRIDYASTVEDAYGDLNKILGGEGIKNLTKDTQQLMNQQLQLAEAMKSMGPLLDSAKSMLDGFDMKDLGGLADFAKNFSSSPAAV